MKLKLDPQFSDRRFKYVFHDDKIIATLGKTSEEYDFKEMSVGELTSIESTFDPSPVTFAQRKEDGELYVQIYHGHSEHALEEEKFPEWLSIREMEGLLKRVEVNENEKSKDLLDE